MKQIHVRSQRKARENVCGRATIGFGFSSDWSRKWSEFIFFFLKSKTKHSNSKPEKTRSSIEKRSKIQIKEKKCFRLVRGSISAAKAARNEFLELSIRYMFLDLAVFCLLSILAPCFSALFNVTFIHFSRVCQKLTI